MATTPTWASDQDLSDAQETEARHTDPARTPTQHSEAPISDERRSSELTATQLDTPSEEERAFAHPWWTDSEEERLDKEIYYGALDLSGGGGQTNPKNTGKPLDEIGTAMQIARSATTRILRARKRLPINSPNSGRKTSADMSREPRSLTRKAAREKEDTQRGRPKRAHAHTTCDKTNGHSPSAS